VRNAAPVGKFDRPFHGSRAVAARELTRYQLDHDFVRIYRNVYVSKRVEVTAQVRAIAAAMFAGKDCVLVGFSAAAMYGTKWISNDEPGEVLRAGHFRAPMDCVVRRYDIEPSEIVTSSGIRITSPARTAFDLARTLPRAKALEVIDALCNATGLDSEDIRRVADRHPGARGIIAARSVINDVDGGAESPPETQTRLLIVDSGLPRPKTQVYVFDDEGKFVARSDLGWPQWKVLVEYEGIHHWSDRVQRARDLERYAQLEALGWIVVRVGAELLNDRPTELVARVRAKLRAAGAPV
jgi:hypothetical protein